MTDKLIKLTLKLIDLILKFIINNIYTIFSTNSIGKCFCVFDIKKMSENLTIDTIACCAFATHTNAIDDPNGPFISQCRKLVDMKASKFLLVLALSKQHYT